MEGPDSDTIALARRSARPTEAYMQRRARETGRRGARKLPKTTLHSCALSLHHTDATGQRRTRARPRERSRHPTCRCSHLAWCRARTRLGWRYLSRPTRQMSCHHVGPLGGICHQLYSKIFRRALRARPLDVTTWLRHFVRSTVRSEEAYVGCIGSRRLVIEYSEKNVDRPGGTARPQ